MRTRRATTVSRLPAILVASPRPAQLRKLIILIFFMTFSFLFWPDGQEPANHESAGKRLSGRTRFANRVPRHALVESARGAVCTRDCYLAAQYRRLVKRDKKAVVAVAHSILVIAYHVLRDGVSYRELGGDYFDHLNAQRLTRYHTQRLAALGYEVTLTKCAA